MRAVVQRVLRSEVTINRDCGQESRGIGPGLTVLLGVLEGDKEQEAAVLAEKVSGLRIFSDANDKMNLSLDDIGGQVLVISNFTLATDCKKGRRPSFDMAAPPEQAKRLYELFVKKLLELGHTVVTGEFGADMRVDIENDGPVTIILDTDKLAIKSR